MSRGAQRIRVQPRLRSANARPRPKSIWADDRTRYRPVLSPVGMVAVNLRIAVPAVP
jgi:hypothetical protein